MLISHPPLARQATDADVIRQSLEHPERFTELYNRHAAGLHRFVARRLGGQLAEDICAEAFAVAFRRRGAYDERYLDARPWLLGIAVKLIGRHRRSEVRLLRALSRTAGEVARPAGEMSRVESEAVEDRLVAAAAGPVLAAALAELPAGQRDVLLLAAWAELTYEEIGVALRLPVGTVRSRLNRARRRVRDALAASGHDAITGGNR